MALTIIQKFRRCTRCGKMKIKEQDFHRKSSGREGFRTFCKACVSNTNRKYRETHAPKQNKEYQREYQKAWRAANPEYAKQYYVRRKKNGDCN